MSNIRTGVVAGATLLAFASPLAPTAAHATVPSPTLVYAADVDNDGVSGLYRATAADPTTRTAVIADNGAIDVSRALISPDGSRIAALVDFAAGSPDTAGLDYQLLTTNLDGSNRHVLAHSTVTFGATTTTLDLVDGFSWTPDSTKLVYGHQHSVFGSSTSNAFSLRQVPANGGSVVDIANSSGLTDPALSADGAQVAAVNLNGADPTLVVAPFPSLSSPTTIGTATNSFYLTPAWSPDGSALAVVKDDTSGGLDASEIDVSRFDSGSSTWGALASAYGPVQGSGASWFAENPVWFDNSTIDFDQFDDSSNASNPPQHLQSIVFTSSWSAPTDITPSDTAALSSPSFAPADVTPPSAVAFGLFTLTPTSVTLRWTTSDADYSHVTLHRTDVTAATGPVDITGVFGTTYVDHNLTFGHHYSYTATVFDGAGNQGPESASRDAMPISPPHITIASPTSGIFRTLPFYVPWGVAQPAGSSVHYDVKFAVKSGTNWALGAPQKFVDNTTAGGSWFHPVGMVAGQTYYFQAVAHDAYGNNTGVTSWIGANVPLDQRSGLFSRNWHTVYQSAFWLGSAAVTGVNGTSVTFTVTSRVIQVIGDLCRACGSFRIYVGGVLKATVSTYSPSTKPRHVLWTASYSTIAKRIVKIVAVLPLHHELIIDGMGDLR